MSSEEVAKGTDAPNADASATSITPGAPDKETNTKNEEPAPPQDKQQEKEIIEATKAETAVEPGKSTDETVEKPIENGETLEKDTAKSEENEKNETSVTEGEKKEEEKKTEVKDDDKEIEEKGPEAETKPKKEAESKESAEEKVDAEKEQTVKEKAEAESMDVDETEKPEEKEPKTPAKSENKTEGEDVEEEVKTPTLPRSVQKKLGDFLETPGDNNTPVVEGKRVRKAVIRHSPTNFPEPQEETKAGRGEKLSDIKSVEKHVKTRARTDPVFRDAHKLLFCLGKRKKGAPKANVIKTVILGFSGYLVEGDTKEDEETKKQKFMVAAHKFVVPVLRDFCDLFDLDRTNSSKEDIVQRLSEFLAAPDKELTKSFIKEKAKKAQSKKRKAADEDDDEDEEIRIAKKAKTNREGGDKEPTEEELRKWAKAYVQCFNLDMATTKHAIETASDKFGFDLAGKKQLIKSLLADEMKGEEDQ